MPKYITKTRKTTSPTGGTIEEEFTEPVYSKRELRAMARRDKAEARNNQMAMNMAARASGANMTKFRVMGYLFSNPYALIAILATVVILILYIMYSANVYLSAIAEAYSSLSAKRLSSKANFPRPMSFISVDENGNTVVSVSVGATGVQSALNSLDDMGTVSMVNINLQEIAEYKEFMYSQGVKSGAAYASYYWLENNPDTEDRTFKAAAIMGNSHGEGSLGQLQGFETMHHDCDIFEEYHKRTGTKYIPDLNNKMVHELDQPMQLKELYQGLLRLTTGCTKSGCELTMKAWLAESDNKNIWRCGFGPTQATYHTYVNKYVEAMKTNHYDTSLEYVTEGHLAVMESSYVSNNWNKSTFDYNRVKDTFSKSSEVVYNELVSDGTIKNGMSKATALKIIEYTMAFLGNYERPEYWPTSDACVKRSRYAIECYYVLESYGGQ